MEEKINQIVIERVENGYIVSLQDKGNKGSFLEMQDKKFYIATNEKELTNIINIAAISMESAYKTNERLKKEELEGYEDD